VIGDDPGVSTCLHVNATAPLVAVATRSIGAFAGLPLKVKAIAAEVAELYAGSAALVAVIKHVPGVSALRVALAKSFESTQLVAVPFDTAYVTAPEPSPPVVENEGEALRLFAE
jgi:hypothetical protein